MVLRILRQAVLAAGVAFAALAIAPGADAAERELGVDCVFCGPGQAIPHHCPRLQGGAPPPPPPPPNPLPGRIGEAVRARLGILAAGDVDLPELGEPGDLERLHAVLDGWVSAVESAIGGLEREVRDALDREVDEAHESARLHNLAIDLEGRLGRLRGQLAEDAAGLGERRQEASRLEEELARVREASERIRAETRPARDRVFRRLAEAERNGWILPPSAYRPLPAPLPVASPSSSAPGPPPGPGVARAGNVARAVPPSGRGEAGARPAASRPFAGEGSVAERLRELQSLEGRLRRASANRGSARRGAEAWRAEREREAAKVSALQSQRLAIEEGIADGKRKLSEARERVAALSALLDAGKRKALRDWIEWGLSTAFDKRTERLMAEASHGGVNTPLLLKFRDVAAAAAQLGSDTLAVAERFPATMAGNGESIEALQRDLDEAKHRFGLSFLSTYTDIPGPILPYLMKAR